MGKGTERGQGTKRVKGTIGEGKTRAKGNKRVGGNNGWGTLQGEGDWKQKLGKGKIMMAHGQQRGNAQSPHLPAYLMGLSGRYSTHQGMGE